MFASILQTMPFGLLPRIACGTGALSDGELFRIGNEVHYCVESMTLNNTKNLIKVLKEAEADALRAKASAEEALAAAKPSITAADKKLLDISVAAKPIMLHLTTYGGCVHGAMAVADAIVGMKVPVHTVVTGYVASAGTLVSICGARRYITPNAFMMVHQIRGGFWGKYTDAKEQVGNLEGVMAAVVKHYLKHTKIPEKDLNELLSRDRDWSAGTCLEHGLADEVL